VGYCGDSIYRDWKASQRPAERPGWQPLDDNVEQVVVVAFVLRDHER